MINSSFAATYMSHKINKLIGKLGIAENDDRLLESDCAGKWSSKVLLMIGYIFWVRETWFEN